MSETIGKVANGQPTDRFSKVVALLRAIPPRERLNVLAGGLIATADELGLQPAQVVSIVNTAMAQRAAVLERMKQGERILFGPDGSPLVPTLAGSVPSSEEAPTADLGAERVARLAALNARGRPPTSACECATWPCPCGCHAAPEARQRFEGSHMAGVWTESAQTGDPGPPCVFCGMTAGKGRHSREAYPGTWHAYRAPVGEQKAPDPKELEDLAAEHAARRPPA